MRTTAAALILSAAALAAGAPAAEARSPADGTYVGSYVCGNGPGGVTLTITSDSRGRLRALLRFYPTAQNPGIERGAYRLAGRLTSTSRQIALSPRGWVDQPEGYVMTGIRGALSRDGRTISGRLTGDPECSTISVRRR